jgi:YesN/AraC family two-component response regulator
MSQEVFTLVDPQDGKLAFKIFNFEDNEAFDHIQYRGYYSIIWITEGEGKVKADYTEYEFRPGSMFSFSLYQPYMICSKNVKGTALFFHPDFFCIHKHQAEVACNGVLFNNIYRPPYITIDAVNAVTLAMLLEQMRSEIQKPDLAQNELLVSYLKIFLITASRLKVEQHPEAMETVSDSQKPFILESLRLSIERDYRTKHSASDYADVLNISAKALAKIAKKHFNKTITELIADRIIIEAKRELYLSNKSIKEIAYELGYQDEYYFSRFFKKNTDVSPQMYRDTIGVGRGMAA